MLVRPLNAALPILGCLLLTTVAHAQVLNSANGHYYEVVTTTNIISWTDARTDAQSLVLSGYTADLVSITSADENAFVAALPGATANECWLGGYQDRTASDYSEPGGGYRWVSGEAFGYTNWNGGEPNNFEGFEDYIHLYGSPRWNDITVNGDHGLAQVRGYVAEFTPSAVPEPGAYAMLMGTALLGGSLLRRRKRQA